jgi:GMP synthase-like glutamine amidotransferase
MRILAFRHVPFEGIGLIEPALRAHGVEIEYADLYNANSPYPQPDAFHALLFMGGPMSVNDPLPYLQFETQSISQAVKRNQPVLGICLGSQLIAKALGARVYPNRQKEIGWYDVNLTGGGQNDPLFNGLPRTNSLFHWHGETFDLPAGATLLASSELCRHQAFRIGNFTYALQFHLEVTPEMIADWCEQDVNCGDMRELHTPVDPWHHSQELNELATNVFGRWCELLKTSQYEPSAR